MYIGIYYIQENEIIFAAYGLLSGYIFGIMQHVLLCIYFQNLYHREMQVAANHRMFISTICVELMNVYMSIRFTGIRVYTST